MADFFLYGKEVTPWEEPGTPPEEGQRKWEAGEEPPAAWWNFFWDAVQKCFENIKLWINGHKDANTGVHGVGTEHIETTEGAQVKVDSGITAHRGESDPHTHLNGQPMANIFESGGVTVKKATHLSGGGQGQIPYQNNPSSTAMLAAGTSGQLLQSGGTNPPSWINATENASTNTIMKRNSSGNVAAAIFVGDLNGNVNGNCSGSSGSCTGNAATATNLSGGGQGQIPYQNNPNSTAMLAAGASGQVLQSGGTNPPSWINATDTATASTIVKRNSSGNVAAAIFVGDLNGNVTGNCSGSSGSCTGNAATATSLSGGGQGQIPYQNNLNSTAMLAAGASGQVLQSGGTNPPSWITATENATASTIVKRNSNGNVVAATFVGNLSGNVTGNCSGSSGSCCGNAATATNLSGGGQGQIPYQNNPNSTAMLAAGTIGQVLQSGGINGPSWISATDTATASTIAKRNSSGNIAATTFVGNLSGNVTGNCSGSSGSCSGNAATATDLSGGGQGQIPYQDNPNSTAMLAAGTSGQVLQSGGTNPPSWITATENASTNTIMKRNSLGNVAAAIFVGDLNGNVNGNCSGSSGSCTGTAATATNVTTNINSHAITDIFESDGVTAKKATLAEAAKGDTRFSISGNLYQSITVQAMQNSPTLQTITVNVPTGKTLRLMRIRTSTGNDDLSLKVKTEITSGVGTYGNRDVYFNWLLTDVSGNHQLIINLQNTGASNLTTPQGVGWYCEFAIV